MSMDNQKEKNTEASIDNLVVTRYDQVIKRLSEAGLKAGDQSLSFIKDAVDEAIELEQTAEEMTADEASLLSVYVYRDVTSLLSYLHQTGEGLAAWLNFDLTILEQVTIDKLIDLSDKTIIENLDLQERLDCSGEQYLTGEVCSPGTLVCLSCGQVHQILHTDVIRECEACHSHCFKRSSK